MMTAPRDPRPTLQVVEDHCAEFRDLVVEVRTFENFQALHLGLLAELPRKTLPAIAQHLGMPNAQGIHHLLVTPHLDTRALAERRQTLARQALQGHEVTLIVDETGDRKKGKTTDYVARQYLGSLGKIDNGLVTVHITALAGPLTMPLCWAVFKPKSRLRDEDVHRSKISLASAMLDEIAQWGLDIELVTSDSLYGMSGEFVSTLRRHSWNYALALRSDFAMRLPSDQQVWTKPWVELERHFIDGKTQRRWAQEHVWGVERAERYVVLTTDPETQPAIETSFVRVRLDGDDWLERLPDAYGRRTWVEAGFRNKKTELGWHDWRLTRWEHIERWYEMVLSAYTLISCEALARLEREEHARVTSESSAPEHEPESQDETRAVKGPTTRWFKVLKEVRSWTRPVAAIAVLLNWSTILALEHSTLHEALVRLYALPFSQ